MISQPRAMRRSFLGGAAGLGSILLLASSPLLAAAGAIPPGFSDRYADVNGTRLLYLVGGRGARWSSSMATPRPATCGVRSCGASPTSHGHRSGPSGSGRVGRAGRRVRQEGHGCGHPRVDSSLGFERISIVGHDIGLMVAYAYAAQFPQE